MRGLKSEKRTVIGSQDEARFHEEKFTGQKSPSAKQKPAIVSTTRCRVIQQYC